MRAGRVIPRPERVTGSPPSRISRRRPPVARRSTTSPRAACWTLGCHPDRRPSADRRTASATSKSIGFLIWNGGPVATRTPDLYRVKEGAGRELSFTLYKLPQLPTSMGSKWSPNSPPCPDALGLRGPHDQPVQGTHAHGVGTMEALGVCQRSFLSLAHAVVTGQLFPAPYIGGTRKRATLVEVALKLIARHTHSRNLR